MDNFNFWDELLGDDMEDTLKEFMDYGGNFGFIARNITVIYRTIEETAFGRHLTVSQKLYATGIIDLFSLISEKKISKRDIKKAVSHAKAARISLPNYEQFHDMPYPDDENLLLANFIMQIEALSFLVTTDANHIDIIDGILEEKYRIQKIARGDIDSTGTPFMDMLARNAALTQINDVKFRKTVLKYFR